MSNDPASNKEPAWLVILVSSLGVDKFNVPMRLAPDLPERIKSATAAVEGQDVWNVAAWVSLGEGCGIVNARFVRAVVATTA